LSARSTSLTFDLPVNMGIASAAKTRALRNGLLRIPKQCLPGVIFGCANNAAPRQSAIGQ
jgi:hypothetical protein